MNEEVDSFEELMAEFNKIRDSIKDDIQWMNPPIAGQSKNAPQSTRRSENTMSPKHSKVSFQHLQRRTSDIRKQVASLHKKQGGLDILLSKLGELERSLGNGRLGRNPLRGVARYWIDQGGAWDHPVYRALVELEQLIDQM